MKTQPDIESVKNAVMEADMLEALAREALSNPEAVRIKIREMEAAKHYPFLWDALLASIMLSKHNR
jgi:hypothetical protein